MFVIDENKIVTLKKETLQENLQYRAPETFLEGPFNAEKALVFALGIILLKIHFLRSPFGLKSVNDSPKYLLFKKGSPE